MNRFLIFAMAIAVVPLGYIRPAVADDTRTIMEEVARRYRDTFRVPESQQAGLAGGHDAALLSILGETANAFGRSAQNKEARENLIDWIARNQPDEPFYGVAFKSITTDTGESPFKPTITYGYLVTSGDDQTKVIIETKDRDQNGAWMMPDDGTAAAFKTEGTSYQAISGAEVDKRRLQIKQEEEQAAIAAKRDADNAAKRAADNAAKIAKKAADDEANRRADDEAKRRADDEAKKKADDEAKKKTDDEKKKQEQQQKDAADNGKKKGEFLDATGGGRSPGFTAIANCVPDSPCSRKLRHCKGGPCILMMGNPDDETAPTFTFNLNNAALTKFLASEGYKKLAIGTYQP